MTGTAPSRSDTDPATKTRGSILDVVLDFLDADGYDGFVVRDVAKVAHVSLTTLYNLFPTRDALIVAALVRWHQSHGLAEAVSPPDGASVRDSLRSLLRQTFEPWERHPNIFKAYVRALSMPDGAALHAQISESLVPITLTVEAKEVKAILADVAYAAGARYAAGVIDVTEMREYLESVVEWLTAGEAANTAVTSGGRGRRGA